MASGTEQDRPLQSSVEGDPGLRAWVEYLHDMGLYDLYRREPMQTVLSADGLARLRAGGAPRVAHADVNRTSTVAAEPNRPVREPAPQPGMQMSPARPARSAVMPVAAALTRTPPITNEEKQRQHPGASPLPPGLQSLPPELAAPMPKPSPLEMLFAAPAEAVPAAQRAAALEQLRAEIGDCTRCPLAYAGRHTIVFGEGDPCAELMFVGEGPGADEDETGRPFVGKAGQLLNNMIGAMGLQREQVFIANIVKCRPPGNRTPEFVEATTCSQFLLKQIDIVRPKVIVALGSTAATYLLGVRQPLSALRGQWLAARGAKVAVTYHPAFLLRDPRQKSEAWKDLQRVMAELGLRGASKA